MKKDYTIQVWSIMCHDIAECNCPNFWSLDSRIMGADNFQLFIIAHRDFHRLNGDTCEIV